MENVVPLRRKEYVSALMFFLFLAILFIAHPTSVFAAAKINLSKASNNVGLVGYWTFDGKTISGSTVRDESGAGNTATAAINLKVTDGKIGQGISFDGTANSVIGAGPVLPLVGNVSISFWVFPAKGGELMYLVSKGLATDVPYQILTDNSASPRINFLRYDDTSTTIDFFSNSSLQIGVWSHVVVTSNQSSDSVIYINGVQDASSAGAGPATDIGSNLYFGSFNGGSNYFDGKMDDIRIYNRVLSEVEVRKLYESGQAEIVSTSQSLRRGLYGYWSFNGNTISGTTVRNAAGPGPNGTITEIGVAPRKTVAQGKVGQAISTSNTDVANYSYVNFGNPADVSTNSEMSISLWTKRRKDAVNTQGILLGRLGDDTGWMLYHGGTPGNQNVSFSPQGPVAVSEGYTTSNFFTLDEWFHITVVFNGNGATDSDKLKIYVNGISQSLTFTAAIQNQLNSAADLSIAYDGVNSYLYDGDMDELRIYSRALSQQEVQQLYNSGLTIVNKATKGLTQGLVGWWTFDGPSISGTTIADSAGSVSNSGTFGGNSKPILGKLGQAVFFDGNDDYVTVADESVDMRPATFTLSAWFNISSYATAQTVISKPRTTAPWSSPFTSWLIRPSSAGIEFGTSNASYSGTLVAVTLEPNRWYHVVMTYDGSRRIGYLDGTEIHNVAFTAPIGYAAQPVLIGADHGASPYGDDLIGSIDDVRIYNRALSRQEVQLLYNASK